MTTGRVAIEVRDVGLQFPRRRVNATATGTAHGALKRLFTNANTVSFTALQGVSFDVRDGEVVGIIGRNGAGKSTLLRVMAGIYRPDTGRVRTAGPVSLLAGLGVGFNQNLSGRDNIYLYGSILGHSRQKMDSLMDAVIAFAELEEFIEEPVRTYSSGMRARLGFSVAQALEPEILLIDEVLAVGDARFKQRSTARILEMVKSAGAVVVASHSFATVREVCTRVLFFERGQMLMDGTPTEVLDRYMRDEPLAVRRAYEKAIASDA
jgi:ABC-type polysaccharide/polyol phosphate transport system ATPase subunit